MTELRFPRSGQPGAITLEQERNEVLEGIFDALGSRAPDADEVAAFHYLLRHLANGGRLTLFHAVQQ